MLKLCLLSWAISIVAGLQIPLESSTLAKSQRSELSKWAASVKHSFLAEVSADKAHDWTLVMGNQAGDTDSLSSARLENQI